MEGLERVVQQLSARLDALEHRCRGSQNRGRRGNEAYESDDFSVDPVNTDPLSAPPPGHLSKMVERLVRDRVLRDSGDGLSGHIYYLTLPANKKLAFKVDHSAGFEVGVKITGSDTAMYWRRNSYETNYPETVIQPVMADRHFQFEGLKKHCWVLRPVCAQRPWLPCPAAAMVRDEQVGAERVIEIMWDDSRIPASFRNIGCTIRII